MSNKQYDNYIPSHLDDPKYVGNFEMQTVVTIFLSLAFSLVAVVKGQQFIAVVLITLAMIYLKLRNKYGQFLDGFLYWHLGFVKLPGDKLKVARKFGVVPTYIRDFEE